VCVFTCVWVCRRDKLLLSLMSTMWADSLAVECPKNIWMLLWLCDLILDPNTWERHFTFWFVNDPATLSKEPEWGKQNTLRHCIILSITFFPQYFFTSILSARNSSPYWNRKWELAASLRTLANFLAKFSQSYEQSFEALQIFCFESVVWRVCQTAKVMWLQ